jgi:hypothetical protein
LIRKTKMKTIYFFKCVSGQGKFIKGRTVGNPS